MLPLVELDRKQSSVTASFMSNGGTNQQTIADSSADDIVESSRCMARMLPCCALELECFSIPNSLLLYDVTRRHLVTSTISPPRLEDAVHGSNFTPATGPSAYNRGLKRNEAEGP